MIVYGKGSVVHMIGWKKVGSLGLELSSILVYVGCFLDGIWILEKVLGLGGKWKSGDVVV